MIAAFAATAVFTLAPLRAQAQTAGRAEASADGGQFITNLATRAISELTTGDLPLDERKARFRALLNEGFDVPGIARFVLGRYWRTASEAEREEYLRLFEAFIVQTYASRFQDFMGAQLRVLATRNGSDGETIASIEASLPSRPPARFDARLRRQGDRFKIFDVVVEGISMSITQRDDFSAVIQRNGGKVEGLLASLREKTRTAAQAQ